MVPRHAMAFLHPQRVPILPHWHQDFDEWHKAKDRATTSDFKPSVTFPSYRKGLNLKDFEAKGDDGWSTGF